MLLSLAAALLLSAEPSSQWLQEARVLAQHLRFEEAITRLEVAKVVPGLEPAERAAVLALLAYCQVAQDRRAEAESTYILLLKTDPTYALTPESSPKVILAFEAAKKKLYPSEYVRIDEQPSVAGQVSLVVIDPWNQVTALTLKRRANGSQWIARVLEAENGRYSFAIAAIEGDRIEWFVEARGESDLLLASVASALSPRVVNVSPHVEIPSAAPVTRAHPTRLAGFITLGAGLVFGAIATGFQVASVNARHAARDRSQAPGDFADTALAAEAEGQQQQGWAVGFFIGAGVATTTGVVLIW